MFEWVALNQLYDYFTSNDLLYENRYGFRKYQSTKLAALGFADRNRQEMDDKKIASSKFFRPF